MNLKDCKTLTLPSLTVGELLDSDFSAEPLPFPPQATIVAAIPAPPNIIFFYTLAAQGRPQEDIDRIVRLGVRKGMYLTEREAVDKLTEHALHQYGVPELALLSKDDYNDLATWLRNVEVTPPVSAL